MQEVAKRLLAENEQLRARRAPREGAWREIARLVLPSHDAFGRELPPNAPDPFVYDDTGEEANRMHAAVLNYLLTPDGQEWHGLAPAEPDLEDEPELARWCELATKQLFKLRDRSLFAAHIHEVYLSVGAFGPGPLLIEDQVGQGFRYEAAPVSEVHFSVALDGTKDRVHRKYRLAARLLRQEFGELPEDLARMAEREPDRDVEILHVVEPNRERQPGRMDRAGQPFASWHISLQGGHVLRSSGYWSMPWAIGRYLVAPGEIEGRSPSWSCLPTLSMLNTMARNELVQDNRRSAPPLLATDDELDPPLLAPNHINYGWLDREGRPLVRPLEVAPDRGHGKENLEAARARVDRAFLVSLFLMLNENPRMTATEVIERSAEKGIVLAPLMGRLQAELLRPCIERELNIAFRAGYVPPPPPLLVESGGLKVTYTSPLARHVAADEARGVLQTAEGIGVLAQFDRAVLDRIDFGAAAELLARANRVPAKLIRSEDQVAAMAEDRRQRADAQQALEAAPVAAQTAASLAKLAGRG